MLPSQGTGPRPLRLQLTALTCRPIKSSLFNLQAMLNAISNISSSRKS